MWPKGEGIRRPGFHEVRSRTQPRESQQPIHREEEPGQLHRSCQLLAAVALKCDACTHWRHQARTAALPVQAARRCTLRSLSRPVPSFRTARKTCHTSVQGSSGGGGSFPSVEAAAPQDLFIDISAASSKATAGSRIFQNAPEEQQQIQKSNNNTQEEQTQCLGAATGPSKSLYNHEKTRFPQ